MTSCCMDIKCGKKKRSVQCQEKHSHFLSLSHTHTPINSVREFANRCSNQSDCIKRRAVPTVQMALAETKYHPETLLFLTAELTSHLTPPSHETNKRDALNQWIIDFQICIFCPIPALKHKNILEKSLFFVPVTQTFISTSKRHNVRNDSSEESLAATRSKS